MGTEGNENLWNDSWFSNVIETFSKKNRKDHRPCGKSRLKKSHNNCGSDSFGFEFHGVRNLRGRLQLDTPEKLNRMNQKHSVEITLNDYRLEA